MQLIVIFYTIESWHLIQQKKWLTQKYERYSAKYESVNTF